MTNPKKRTLPERVPRTKKRAAGATPITATPFRLRLAGVELEPEERKALRMRLGRRLHRFAQHLTLVAVRFKDVNGPRGGVDLVCRIKMSVAGLDHVVVEARGAEVQTTMNEASRMAKVALERALDRRGIVSPRPTKRRAAGSRLASPKGESRRRVPTSRNEKERIDRAGYALEKSVGRPSRKPTRKSANRVKAGSKQGRRQKRGLHAPSARARRA